MAKSKRERNTMRQLNKMAQHQNTQFLSSMLVTIAALMKQRGITRLDISPADFALLVPGEQLEPVLSENGGLSFELKRDLDGNDNLLGTAPIGRIGVVDQ